jgi:hypothetical protein
LILIIFFGPLVAVPIDGLSSHKIHLTPGRTRARDSITFLQALMMVAGGVAVSEAYLTGIYYQLKQDHCSLTLRKISLMETVVPCPPEIARFDRPVNTDVPFCQVSVDALEA